MPRSPELRALLVSSRLAERIARPAARRARSAPRPARPVARLVLRAARLALSVAQLALLAALLVSAARAGARRSGKLAPPPASPVTPAPVAQTACEPLAGPAPERAPVLR